MKRNPKSPNAPERKQKVGGKGDEQLPKRKENPTLYTDEKEYKQKVNKQRKIKEKGNRKMEK